MFHHLNTKSCHHSLASYIKSEAMANAEQIRVISLMGLEISPITCLKIEHVHAYIKFCSAFLSCNVNTSQLQLFLFGGDWQVFSHSIIVK